MYCKTRQREWNRRAACPCLATASLPDKERNVRRQLQHTGQARFHFLILTPFVRVVSPVAFLRLTSFCPLDPLQRSRPKIQFAFCLGIRHASHLSPVNRIRTTGQLSFLAQSFLLSFAFCDDAIPVCA